LLAIKVDQGSGCTHVYVIPIFYYSSSIIVSQEQRSSAGITACVHPGWVEQQVVDLAAIATDTTGRESADDLLS
jgi:hypothetical protein